MSSINLLDLEQVETVAAALRPTLNQYGGVCYVSDAMEIREINSVS